MRTSHFTDFEFQITGEKSMQFLKRSAALMLNICLASVIIPAAMTGSAAAQAQDVRVALQRGYRTGYSDGYMAGYRDTIDSLARDFSRHAEYSKADRAFNKDYGRMEDYRDGYQQGFESGYTTGYEKRSFDSNLPGDLKRRGGVGDAPPAYENTSAQYGGDPVAKPANNQNSYQNYNSDSSVRPTIIIPRDTELLLELQTDLSAERSREGDRFTAKIVSPSEIAGASIEGRVSKVRRSGRIKRRSELLLSFDRVILNDSRSSNFSATLMEVMAVKGDNIKFVDNEGTAVGHSSLKDDSIKVGAATGTGLIVGAVAGGPVGAAIGAGVGAAVGVGAVVIQRGNQVRLNKNQQLRVKSACETQIH
jgi:hypothetical protein